MAGQAACQSNRNAAGKRLSRHCARRTIATVLLQERATAENTYDSLSLLPDRRINITTAGAKLRSGRSTRKHRASTEGYDGVCHRAVFDLSFYAYRPAFCRLFWSQLVQ